MTEISLDVEFKGYVFVASGPEQEDNFEDFTFDEMNTFPNLVRVDVNGIPLENLFLLGSIHDVRARFTEMRLEWLTQQGAAHHAPLK